MSNFHWKFGWNVLWIGIFLFIPSLLCYKAYHGILSPGDTFFLCLFACAFCLDLICNELIKMGKLFEERHRESVRLHNERVAYKEPPPVGDQCPECGGKGQSEWEGNGLMSTCWQCNGTGKVVGQ